jgi:RHS repeat-associated protein
MKKILLTYSLLFAAWVSINAQTTQYPEIIYESLFDNNNFTQSTDVNLSAGATAGDVSVTPSGAAMYNIPISVPSGTHGVVPQLSIGYSSQGGNGLLGIGWNLSGLSAISRSGKSIAYDNTVSPVKLNNDDYFILDGNRLEVTSGLNGVDYATYATKMETFSKITSYGWIAPYGTPQYFIVEMKNGMIYEYGNSTDSKLFNVDGNRVISWQLSKVRDQYGNYMTYLYETTPERELILKEINYTGNVAQNLTPYNKVKFDYGVRRDKNMAFIAGEKVTSRSLLTQITVTTEDSKPVRKYEFTYGLKNDKSYLKRVREAGSDGKFMNPTIFKYGLQSEPIVYVGPTNTVFDNQASFDFFNQFYADVFSTDYNGDGFADFLVAHKAEYPGDPNVYYDEMTIYLQKPNAEGKLSLTKGPTKYFDYSTGEKVRVKENFTNILGFKYYSISTNNTLEPVDVNGDGRFEHPIIYIKDDPSFNTTRLNKVELLSLNADGTAFEVFNCQIPNNITVYREKKYLYFSDFDGDGRTDYFFNTVSKIDGTGLNYGVGYNYISYPGKQIFNETVNFSDAFPMGKRILESQQIDIIDFDGDSKSEFFFQAPNTHKDAVNYYSTYRKRFDIFHFKRINNTTYLEKLYEETNLPYPVQFDQGDFNGDGKTDFLIHSFANDDLDEFSYPQNPNWRISYSDGIALRQDLRFEFWGAGNYPDMKKDRVFINDYDGDGLSDVMFFKDTKDATGTIEIRFFTNKGSAFQLFSKTSGINYSEGLLSDVFIQGDFNGDGQLDIVDIERKKDEPFGANFKTRYYNFFPKTQERLLTNVMNGMKAESVIEYGLATYRKAEITGFEFFKKTGVSIYPINYIVPPMNLARAIEVPNGNNGNSSTKSRFEYLYDDPKVHRGGFGYLGFTKVTTFDRTNKTESTTEFETLTSPLYKYVTNVVKKQTSLYNGPDPNNPTVNIIKNLSENVSTNSFVEANGRYRLQTDKVEEYNRLSGGFVSKDFKYDEYGNLKEEKTITNHEEYSGVLYGGFTSIGNSVPVLPAWKTVNNSRDNVNFSKDVQYQYTPQGALLQEKSFAFNNTDPTKYVLTEYEYNPFGNLIRTKLSSPQLPNNIKISTSTYDTKGRFELAMTNNAGQTSSKTYYPEWGTMKTATAVKTAVDLVSFTSTFEYDGMGRLTKSIDPFGNQSTTEYKVLDYGFFTKSKSDNSPFVWKYYNFLGKELGNVITYSSLAQYYNVTQLSYYNAKGLLESKYIPNKETGSAGAVPKKTRTTYDYLNRPLTVKTDGIDGETSYAYTFSQGKTTIEVTNNAGQKSSKTTDASGKVISTTDHGGTITFKYDGRGNQTEVKLSGQVITTMEYDAWGRQSALVDANAGRTDYEYNAYGELIRQKDAKNNQYTMKYDDLGRMWERTGPEGVTKTEFYTTGVAINEVKKVTSFNGITEDYEYDTRGRVQKVTETIANLPYAKTFTYNTFNQVLTTTYPSGLVVTNTYNTEGMLVKVMSGTQLLFDATSGKRDAFGHWTEYTRGDNKLNKSEYNAYGTPTSFNTEGVQDLRMVWDLKVGNLLSRQDARRYLKEDFLYTDNLNRLNQAQVVGLQPYTFVFKENGNIDSKSDAGAKYIYDAAKINAVKYVKDYKNTIPSIQQDITYTPFLRCSTITEGANQLEYTYASDYERRKGILKINNIVENTRLYLGDYEINTDKNGVKTFVHYLSAAEAIVVKSGNNAFEYYFPYTDHLGSIVAVTNTSGVLVAEQNFDAWGRKRNPNTWDYINADKWGVNNVGTIPSWLYRGFTGHEHLDAFGLINMNARLYDPVLGRMLSPDNFAHEGTQGLNRYSYANNNPLIYTDPDGNHPALIILGKFVVDLLIRPNATPTQRFVNVGINIASSYFSSFISGGVKSAMSGYNFWQGAIHFGDLGPMKPMVTGVWNGMVAGAVGGFSSSLIHSAATGFNDNAAQQLLFGTLADAIMGGISGYFDAKSRGFDHRWSGEKVVEEDWIPTQKATQGNDDAFCNLCSNEGLEPVVGRPYDYAKAEKNVTRYYQDPSGNISTNPNGKFVGTNPEQAASIGGYQRYDWTPDDFHRHYVGALQRKEAVGMTWINKDGTGHSVAGRGWERVITGTGKIKTYYHIMNPNGGFMKFNPNSYKNLKMFKVY